MNPQQCACYVGDQCDVTTHPAVDHQDVISRKLHHALQVIQGHRPSEPWRSHISYDLHQQSVQQLVAAYVAHVAADSLHTAEQRWWL